MLILSLKVSNIAFQTANSVDSDQNAPLDSLIRVYTDCTGLSVQTCRVNMLYVYQMANCVDPDQTAPKEQFDLGLHCLHR